MARPPRHKVEINDALLGIGTKASAIAEFLTHGNNQQKLRKFYKLDEDSYSVLVEKLYEGDEDAIDFIDSKLGNPAALPSGLSLSPQIKKIILRAQRREEWENFKNSIKRLNPIGMLANVWALAMSSRYTRQERTPVALATLAGAFTGTAMASILSGNNGAQAAVPPTPEPIEHHQEFDTARFGPLELTVTTPHQTTNPLSDEFLMARAGEIPHLSFSPDGITYKKWRVPEEVVRANVLTEFITNIPASLAHAIQASESSFNPNAENDDTAACGLGQFLPSTLAEKVYNYAALMGYPEAKKLVVRFEADRDKQNRVIHGFRPVDEAAEEKLRELCFDPNFNTRLSSVYIIRNIGAIQKNLAYLATPKHDYYPATSTHAYLSIFAGRSKAERMITDMHETGGEVLAHMFFDKKGTNDNAGYLFVNGERDKPRTVATFLEFLREQKGLGDEIMADMRNWSELKVVIQENIQRLSAARAPLLGG